ncbi:hypothetical protein [Halostagnicola sp. A-GB9-2]|uniref:hypothetical protein n=1 Tax=Halostagnicola sp. A-GB9-2 TaxID=3048066 RepID=UPI0024BFBA58|nr:hypothetical protein [Halostagnicola sp. A-GB9-2]MDJ1430737.1 hypothetical protein [Halostagnicola sp. A-GB9-2]
MTSSTTDLVVDIVRTLEKQGVPRDAYQLASEFDPEALARLVDSGGSTVEVHLEVQGVSLLVTNLGARVTDEEPSTHPSALNVDSRSPQSSSSFRLITTRIPAAVGSKRTCSSSACSRRTQAADRCRHGIRRSDCRASTTRD